MSFNAGSEPASSAKVRAWYTYHFPVRIDMDTLNTRLTRHHRVEIPSLPLIEIKDF